MPKVVDLTNEKGEFGCHYIECPACGYGHGFDSRWSFNGDYDKPTFTPSMLVNANMPQLGHRCHSFITDGKIQFLSDCTHKYAGQTMDLPDV
jgi:hypothetical protein